MAKHRRLGVKILCAVLLTGAVCGTVLWRSWECGLVTMKFDSGDPPRLIWGDRIYNCYGDASGNPPAGKQIGTIAGHSDSRVFEAPGRPEEEWLVVTESDEMTIYTLYRRATVSGMSSGSSDRIRLQRPEPIKFQAKK